MTWTYEAGIWEPGTSCPDGIANGVIKISNGAHSVTADGSGFGSFMLVNADGLFGTPQIRSTATNLALGHGQFAGQGFFAAREFDLHLTVIAEDVRDLGSAEDFLKACVYANPNTLVTVTFQRPSWAAPRTCQFRLSGAVTTITPTDDPATPWRDLVIPCSAPDPRTYGAEESVALGGTHSGINGGTFPAPWSASFPAGTVNPSVTVDGTTVNFPSYTVPSGTTLTLSSAERTATLTGDHPGSAYGFLAGTWADLSVGGTVTGTSGGTFSYRDAWL